MAYICKQPNGLYCRFSDVVDTVTDWNMSKDDYINLCVTKAIENAIKDAEEVLNKRLFPFEQIKKDFFPANNTVEEFEEILKEMGDTEGLSDERKNEIKEILEDIE